MANPVESALGSTAADALSGTTDTNTGRIYNTIGDSTYYTEHYEHEVIANRMLALANQLRVVKDGALTYGVFAGKYMDGTTEVNYAGSTGNALTDDATNYIYITAAGTLTKNTTGFPSEATTPHIPLATILTASGAYAHTDITDMRGRGIFQVLYGTMPAIADPGDAGAIPVTRGGYCALVTGGVETRTLANPAAIGQRLLLFLKTDGGNCNITCASAIEQDGDSVIQMDDAGDAIELVGIEDGADKEWRIVFNDGCTVTAP